MTEQNVFWLAAGVMLGAVSAILLARLTHATTVASGAWRARAPAMGFALVLIVTATGLYLSWGRPDLIGARAPSAPARPAGSLDAAAGSLAARLVAKGGTSEEWELLAKSYDFLGRSADAAAARAHIASRAPTAQTGGASAWLAEAGKRRRERDFAGAIAAYERAIGLGGMSADAWADYADALASSAGGRLAGAPARAIAEALKLDATHQKALWLEASLALEERRHEAALELWSRLRGLVPDDSPDAPVIDGNIAEARALLAREPPATAAPVRARTGSKRT